MGDSEIVSHDSPQSMKSSLRERERGLGILISQLGGVYDPENF